MSIIQGNAHTSAGGYQIERSLRFNSADSAYLNRTPASAGNRRTFTWSGWVKRCNPNTTNTMFAADVDVNNFFAIWFREQGDNGRFEVLNYSSGYDLRIETTQVFRDVSAWYHVVVAIDTTQATSTNRVKIYINGSQVTALSTTTYPSQNFDTDVNTTNSHKIGVQGSSYGLHNGYLTEVNFIDGQALTPSDFGETDSNTGVWKPKAYTGTYGTNGFFLKFADNSNTTAATLGKDSSGNGNNWTPNNFSVTAGAGNDSLVDSPTSYGTDTGVGGTVRGNYATLNPNDNGNSNILLTNGNLSVSSSTTWDRGVKGTFGISSGKWYYEYTHGTVNAGTNPAADIGWTKYPSLVNSYANGGGGSSDTYLVQGSNGNKNNGGTNTAYGSAFTTGDVEMCAIDLDNGKIYWGKNGTWFASGDPVAGTNAAYTGVSGTFLPLWYWGISPGTSGVLISNINFGQRAFAYTAPSGFKALCTQNLPTPTIGATSTTQANDYMNVVLWTGDGTSTRSITGVGFQPDWVWIKSRNNAITHRLSDAVRGANKVLYSNLTNAEDTNDNNGYTSSFDSDGFTLTAGATNSNATNASTYTYVAWNWKANGAGSSNTAGTITSTVSANTTSGFSIVTYTGTAANATVGHGLGVAPKMIITKRRTTFTSSWGVWHTSIAATEYLLLNSTAAKATATNAWNSTAPSSTVVSLGDASFCNGSVDGYVMYCFAPVAGYSAFGSYVANGSTDGVFVFCGFRPRFFLIKDTTSANDWLIYDTARNPYNLAGLELLPNSSGAEATGNRFDILSNGFKIRGSGGAHNTNGNTYIYAAFAETPAKFSLAR